VEWLLHFSFQGQVSMKIFLFSLYYARLIIAVGFGFHQTIHPLNVKWRWEHWPLRDANGQPQPFWRAKWASVFGHRSKCLKAAIIRLFLFLQFIFSKSHS